MRTCPRCHRSFPGVENAPTQWCPHCGHEGDAESSARPLVSASPMRADPAAAAGHAFRFFGKHWGRLLALWFPAVLVDIAVALILRGYANAAGIPLDGGMSDGQRMGFLGVALPLYFASFTVKFALWSVIGAYVLDDAWGGARMRALRARVPAALGLGAVLTLAYLAGFLLLIVPFLFVFHWFVFAPVAFGDGKRVSEAFESSRAFARERRTFGFTALVLFLALGVLVIGFVLGAMALRGLDAAGLRDGWWADAAGPVTGWFLAPLVALFPASYYALAQREPAPPVPSASAPAAERFRTTKCPQCATLIPYSATGEPVDVACPVCGRTGRVL